MFSHFSRAVQTNAPGVVNDASRGQQRRRPRQSCYDTCTEQWRCHAWTWVWNNCQRNQCAVCFVPESTVYLSASCATMLTRPSNREVIAEPRSLRKRDSHTRQYCSPHPPPKLPHGAWKESGIQHLCFMGDNHATLIRQVKCFFLFFFF